MNRPQQRSSSVHSSLKAFFGSLIRFVSNGKVFRCAISSEERSSQKAEKKRNDPQKRANFSTARTSESEETILTFEVPQLSLGEVAKKTSNFGSEFFIGEGTYGKVYYAVLEDWEKVAIKKLKGSSRPGAHAELLVTLSKVSKSKHQNIVELLGYYVERDLQLLSYEFATMGSLHDVLHGRKGAEGSKHGPVLDWAQRMKIAYGAAKGLVFLHGLNLVHQNIRSSNILLFEGLKAKIADFNLYNQNWTPDDASQLHSTQVLGSFGYNAPEYALQGFSDKKGDIYSFGIVLLELLTGRKPFDEMKPKKERSLVLWAGPKLTRNRVHECVDPRLEGSYPLDKAAKFAAVAALCVQYEPMVRPGMSILANVLAQLGASKD